MFLIIVIITLCGVSMAFSLWCKRTVACCCQWMHTGDIIFHFDFEYKDSLSKYVVFSCLLKTCKAKLFDKSCSIAIENPDCMVWRLKKIKSTFEVIPVSWIMHFQGQVAIFLGKTLASTGCHLKGADFLKTVWNRMRLQHLCKINKQRSSLVFKRCRNNTEFRNCVKVKVAVLGSPY